LKLAIQDLIKDYEIYPRQQVSRKTVESYVEALKAGAKFPPIVVQRIKESETEKTIILDGYHRLEAYAEYNKLDGVEPIEEVEVEFWRDEVLNKEEYLTELRLKAASLNSTHGDRLSEVDKKGIARKIRERDPHVSQQKIADALAVTQRTVSNWVQDIEAKQKAEQQAVIYRLNALGWTQQEIAEVVGLNRTSVSRKLCNLENLLKLTKSLLERGDSVADVAEKLRIDLTLAWALVLDGLDDLSRLKKLTNKIDGLNCTPRPYDVWNFSECCDLMGYEYEGRIPGQLVLQLLYFFTKQGDCVVDPMAGSGTMVDACLLMNRRCLAFDISPKSYEKRQDIRKSDAIEAIRSLKHKVHLIFIDPPYFKKREKEYGEKSISNLTRDEYLNYFKVLAETSIKKLKESGKVALLMSDYTETNPRDSIFIYEYIQRFLWAGFSLARIILCPLSTQSLHARFQEKFVSERKLGRLARYLVVFKC